MVRRLRARVRGLELLDGVGELTELVVRHAALVVLLGAKGQLRQHLERVVRGRRARTDALEEVAKIVPEPSHRAIVR